MTKYKMRRVDIASVIRSVRKTIAALHNREIEFESLNERTPPQTIRFSPSFVAGKPKFDIRGLAYTSLSLARFLGDVDSSRPRNPRAGQATTVALAMLSLQEQGHLAPGAATKMAEGLSLNSLRQLTSGLARKRKRKRSQVQELKQAALVLSLAAGCPRRRLGLNGGNRREPFKSKNLTRAFPLFLPIRDTDTLIPKLINSRLSDLTCTT